MTIGKKRLLGKTEFLIRLLNIGKILTIGKISKNNKIFPLGKKDLTIGKKRNSSNEYNLIRLLGKIDLTIGKKRLILTFLVYSHTIYVFYEELPHKSA